MLLLLLAKNTEKRAVNLQLKGILRVAMAGETRNLKVHFSRHGKHRKFGKKNIKNIFLHGEFRTYTGNILRAKNNNELVI